MKNCNKLLLLKLYIVLIFLCFTITASAAVTRTDNDNKHINIRRRRRHLRKEGEDTSSAVTLKEVGDNGNSTTVFLLEGCKGDCDNDSECQDGLVCMQREGDESILGCVGEARFCIRASTPGSHSPTNDKDRATSDQGTEQQSATVYEAEDFIGPNPNGGVRFAANRQGFTGRGFADYGGQGTFMDFTNVDGGSNSSCSLIANYANGAPATRYTNILVNGQNTGKKLTFPTTLEWDNWADSTPVEVKCSPGATNTITLIAATSRGGPNLNSLKVITSKTASVDDSSLPSLPVTFSRGDLSVVDPKLGIRLCKGMSARVIAQANQPVRLANGSVSTIPFHSMPDGAAIIPMDDDDGYVYISNSEMKEKKGGVYGLYFNKHGDIIDYKQLLSGTTRNCSGGKTTWNTWLSCEEYGRGQCWQVDPKERRPPQITKLGGVNGGNYEAVAVDHRRKRQESPR